VYDALHNQQTLQLAHLRPLFLATKPLADYVVRGQCAPSRRGGAR
jgi:hypothetical protein